MYFFQLDALPKDELVKFVKSKMLALQKTKAKCDGKMMSYCLFSLMEHLLNF